MKLYAALLLAALLVLASPRATVCRRASGTARGGARCDPLALRPCAPVVFRGARPSAECCARLREQRPCVCAYGRHPELRKYIYSPEGKRIAAACHVRVRGLRC